MYRAHYLYIIALFLLCAPSAFGDGVYRYVDESGQTHYVTTREKVPEQYRTQVNSEAALPALGKSKSGPMYAPADPNVSHAYDTIDTGGRKKVEIFVTSWCQYCKKLEAFLRQKGIAFTRYDIEHDEKGKKIYESIGGGGVPVVRVGKQVIRGFDPEGLLRAIKKV